MSYSDGDNRLQSVTNTGSQDTGTFSYKYDSSGNLTSDTRNRLEIRNNVLNLPSVVSAWDASGAMAGLMTYTYIGDGTKVAARVPKDLVGYVKANFPISLEVFYRFSWTDYRPAVQQKERTTGRTQASATAAVSCMTLRESGVQSLESVSVSTGRLIALTGTNGAVSFESEGFITDHLGNVAAVVNLSASSTSTGAFILEQNGYHPFGTKKDLGCNLSTNRWRYAGKEEQDIAGMGLRLLDFGARFYDPYTLRWNAVDPLAHKYFNMSPYNYCGNDPVNMVDPDGKWAHIVVGVAIGAVIEGIVAYSTGKSGKEFWGAVANGAVAGGITAATAGLGSASIAADLCIGVTLGAAAGAAGSTAEQLVADGYITGSEIAKGAAEGAVNGVITRGASKIAKTAINNSAKAINSKYSSGSKEMKAITNEVKSEMKEQGLSISGKSGKQELQKRVLQRASIFKKVETSATTTTINTAKEIHNYGSSSV